MASAATNSLKDHLDMVMDLQKKGQNIQAIEHLSANLTQFSGHSRPYFLLGVSLLNLEQFDKARDFISRAIAIEPGEAEYHTSLGIILSKLGKAHLAKIRWKEAIRLKPNQAEPHFHIGDTMIDEGNPGEAIDYLQKAVAIKPDFVEAWNNLGLCHKALKELDRALDCFTRAVELNRELADSHINLAMAHLVMGDYEAGWREYEWRFKQAESPMSFAPPDGAALWRGEEIRDEKLVIIAEQGFGDTIQFARYLPRLRELCAGITMLVPHPLVPLLAEIPELDLVISDAAGLGRFDRYCPLLSIPHILKTTLGSIPQKNPYLNANHELVAGWGEKLPEAPVRVGLVWEGKPLFQNDPLRRRSTCLQDLAPLAARDDAIFFSLQKGEPAKQIENAPDNMRIIDLDRQINNFADTAAIIANLDIVISIDTATAHLGGALGKPTWTLLPFSPDWRWGLDQDKTPWYPNSTLFRQQEPNQWQAPIEEMARRLQKWSKP